MLTCTRPNSIKFFNYLTNSLTGQLVYCNYHYFDFSDCVFYAHVLKKKLLLIEIHKVSEETLLAKFKTSFLYIYSNMFRVISNECRGTIRLLMQLIQLRLSLMVKTDAKPGPREVTSMMGLHTICCS